MKQSQDYNPLPSYNIRRSEVCRLALWGTSPSLMDETPPPCTFYRALLWLTKCEK